MDTNFTLNWPNISNTKTSYMSFFFNKDEHKVKHKTILTQGIYVHLRNQPRQREPNLEA